MEEPSERGRRRPTFGRRLLVLLLSFALALVLAEVLFDLCASSLGIKRALLAEYRLFVTQGSAAFEPRPHTVYSRRKGAPGRNSLGFSGSEWELEKKPGTLRILCLGSSTTEGGNRAGPQGSYPFLLQQGLEQKTALEVEVLNAGIAGWTSAEELVSWFLTLQDYVPDLLVIHEAINDVHPRLVPGFRSDYVHWRHSWNPPRFGALHSALVEISDLYTWLWAERPDYDILALTAYAPPQPVPLRPETARPFERNVRTIGESAERRGAGVLLLTMPLRAALEPGENPALRSGTREHNQILRDLARQKGWMLADAELAWENAAELEREFSDICHLSPRGNEAKAGVVIETLLREWAPVRPASEKK